MEGVWAGRPQQATHPALFTCPRLTNTSLSRPGPWRRLPPPGTQSAGRPRVQAAGLGDSFRDLFDFEKWAPRSSRTWRLGQQPSRPSREGELSESAIEVLNQRLADARRDDTSSDALATDAAAADFGTARSGSGDGPLNRSSAQEDQRLQQDGGQEAGSGNPFTQSTDDDFADALNRRIEQVAGSLASDDEEDMGVLTGPLLRELVVAKYGKAHDFSFVRRDLPLGKTLVALNIMFPHLGQKSFPLQESEYDDKLDGIAMYLRAWGQDGKVVAFLKEPARPRSGLPARPVVGTAISIQLDLDKPTIDEWFPQR